MRSMRKRIDLRSISVIIARLYGYLLCHLWATVGFPKHAPCHQFESSNECLFIFEAHLG